MSDSTKQSRIKSTVPLDQEGVFRGDLMLRYSDNHVPLGYYPIPIMVVKNGEGPTALLIGGVHGDEFEGPTALMRLANRLDAGRINGRLIIIPALNAAAIQASSRTSPLDGMNLNRAFPGNPDGCPTEMLADYIERVLMPQCDLVIDLHTGGKASIFKSCTLVSRTANGDLYKRNLALAQAFGLPLVWLLGEYNDDRSVNSAALRTRVPMIATELGGGGGSDPSQIDMAESGLRRCLASHGILENPRRDEVTSPAGHQRMIEIRTPSQNLHAPVSGLFDRKFSAGDEVKKGQSGGCIYPSDPPWAEPVNLYFPQSGLVLAHGNRGNVTRGDMLAMVANDVSGF